MSISYIKCKRFSKLLQGSSSKMPYDIQHIRLDLLEYTAMISAMFIYVYANLYNVHVSGDGYHWERFAEAIRGRVKTLQTKNKSEA